MKVFVYTKEQKPKKIAVIKDVIEVTTYEGIGEIVIVTRYGVNMKFDTSKVKTTIYQN